MSAATNRVVAVAAWRVLTSSERYGVGTAILTYEARTATTDVASRAKFRRYWWLVGPFAGLLMRQAIAATKADAERRHRAHVQGNGKR